MHLWYNPSNIAYNLSIQAAMRQQLHTSLDRSLVQSNQKRRKDSHTGHERSWMGALTKGGEGATGPWRSTRVLSTAVNNPQIGNNYISHKVIHILKKCIFVPIGCWGVCSGWIRFFCAVRARADIRHAFSVLVNEYIMKAWGFGSYILGRAGVRRKSWQGKLWHTCTGIRVKG